MTGDTPSEWQYVAAAYLVVFVTVLLWVAIIAAKLQRLQREVGAIVESARKTAWLRRSSGRRCSPTVRRRSRTRRPRSSRAATWGVRVGWLAQTALLVVQAARTDGFPWSTWAGSLNLFVWLVVGAYLIWGCRPRFRLLGLAVMPLGGGALRRGAGRRRHRRR